MCAGVAPSPAGASPKKKIDENKIKGLGGFEMFLAFCFVDRRRPNKVS